MRPGEVNGTSYHFVTMDRFNTLLKQGTFLEHAKVFDHYYATSRQVVEQQLTRGQDVILEIDWYGAQQIRKQHLDVLSIFILPPSKTILHERLTARGQDDVATIKQRMHDADSELSHYNEYDYLVVNDDFAKAVSDLRSIFQSTRLLSQAQTKRHQPLINKLLNQPAIKS